MANEIKQSWNTTNIKIPKIFKKLKRGFMKVYQEEMYYSTSVEVGKIKNEETDRKCLKAEQH